MSLLAAWAGQSAPAAPLPGRDWKRPWPASTNLSLSAASPQRTLAVRRALAKLRPVKRCKDPTVIIIKTHVKAFCKVWKMCLCNVLINIKISRFLRNIFDTKKCFYLSCDNIYIYMLIPFFKLKKYIKAKVKNLEQKRYEHTN